jgi:hypothetical protein
MVVVRVVFGADDVSVGYAVRTSVGLLSTVDLGVAMANEQKFLVFSNPVEGKVDEYNDWYDNVHLGEVCQVPGVTGARRYDFAPIDGATPTHVGLAIYDLANDADPVAVLAELSNRAGNGEMNMSPALDLTTISMGVWRPRG